MIIFSSPAAAMREGFRILEFDREHCLYLVQKELMRGKHRACVMAFARLGKDDPRLAGEGRDPAGV